MDNALLFSYFVFMILMPALPLLAGGDYGYSLSLGHGHFIPLSLFYNTALALVFSATIMWRRLRWEPVGGWLVDERVETREMRVVSTTYYWRWTLGGREYEASDLMPALLCAPVSGGRAHTLWVDPGDPSRLLPPSWRERLAVYLLWAPVVLSVGLGNLGWRWEPGMRLLSLMVSHPFESMLAIGATAACVELWWSRL